MRTIQRYGWRPSLPDARDLTADHSGIPVLPEVDPRAVMTPIYDQGQLGSCTANSVARVIDYDRIVNGEAPIHPSRLALYALERLIEGTPLTADTGAMGRDGFKVSQQYGILPETEMPYNDKAPSWQQDPRPLLLKSKAAIKLERPYKVVARSEQAFKAVLSNRQMIAFGFSVYESFESTAVAKTGIAPTPQAGEKVLGGHEVVAIGYLKKYPHHVLCANSWGPGWGLGGCFLLPWQFILDPSLSSDFRTIYRPLG